MIRPLVLLALTPLLAAQEPPATATPRPAVTVEQILSVPEPGRFRNLFQQFRTEHVALSPDGHHVALSVREGTAIYVLVLDWTQPEKIKARVRVVDDEAATYRLAFGQREDNPGQIQWMRWVTANRIVVGTNESFPRGTGAIFAFDADGKNARRLADPNDLMTPPPLGDGFASFANRPFARTPDMSDAEVAEAEAAASAVLGLALPSQSENSGIEASNPVIGGGLQVFDLDPKRAGAVTLLTLGTQRGNGTSWVDFQSLDAKTGKLTPLNSSITATNEAMLLDRQGRPRLGIPGTNFRTYPLRYSYYGEMGSKRAQPLSGVPGAQGFEVSPENFFGERSVPLGFAEDSSVLYFASNVGRNTHGIYSLNLKTGQRSLAMENPDWDLIDTPASPYPGSSSLIFDRYSHELAGVRYQSNRRTAAWLTPELRAVQTELEQALPGKNVEISEWDESRQRFLVSSDGAADPGAFHLYDRATGRLVEFARRAPWVDAHHSYPTIPFAVTLPNGTRLNGFVTVPREPRMKPIPMILICPEAPWARANPDYNREVHALAGMGFVVAQISGRGAWGTGRDQRNAITQGYDLVQVADIATAVDLLSQRFQINPKRVALLGRGHGGFIALRALQEHPDKFRCAIAMEPPVDLGKWLADMEWNNRNNVFLQLSRNWLGDEARLKAAPLVSAPEKITKPVLLFSYPRAIAAPPDSTQAMLRPVYLAARQFATSVRRHGGSVEWADLHDDYVSGLPSARAEVFDRIEEFLNLNIYDFRVKLDGLKIVQQ